MNRFTRLLRCPVCDGFDSAPRGKAVRCHGFLSDDGVWAHCSRNDGGGLLREEDGGTFPHRLIGDCRCGSRHGENLGPAADLYPDVKGRDRPFKIIATYPYRDEEGGLLYEVIRLDPKGFRQRRPDGKNPDAWVWDLKGTRRVLFRLPELRDAIAAGRTVFIPEGEKDVLNLVKLGLAATCNAGGAAKKVGDRKWVADFADALAGTDVVIIPDNDKASRAHSAVIARSLLGKAARIRVLDLPDLPPKADVSDWLAAGHTKEELLRLADAAPEWNAPPAEIQPEVEDKPSAAAQLLRLGREAELFHDERNDGYAAFETGGCRRVFRIRGSD
ncbi:MAG: hypothetical protein ACREMY_10525, partial [bacterium]